MSTPAPPQADLAQAYNAAQLANAQQTAQAVAAVWAGVNVADIGGSFADILTQLLALIVRGQLLGALTAVSYHNGLLAQAGLAPTGPTLNPSGYTDPERLAVTIGFAPIRVKQQIAAGLEPIRAMDAGRAELAMIAATETQEAARGVMDVALNTEDQYSGWKRQPNPGACARCLILSGRVYRKNDGFLRHPHCHCTHVPLVDGEEPIGPAVVSPRERFDALSREEQDRVFTKDGAEAIRSGADIGQVVNARRGMRNAGDGFTNEGTRRRRRQRLSPLGARRQAGGDRDRYLELLRSNGYIFGNAPAAPPRLGFDDDARAAHDEQQAAIEAIRAQLGR